MLRVIHTKTGEPIEIGDEITDFRGDRAVLLSLDRVNEMRYGGRRSGKITVKWEDHRPTVVYDSVFDITVIETDWEDKSREAVE